MVMQRAFWGSKPFDLRELPEAYQPHKRVETEGVSALSTLELIALLVGPARGESAMDVAGRVLALGDRLLQGVTAKELVPIVGTREKARRLIVAIELGRRLVEYPALKRPEIRTPEDMAAILEPRLRHLDREHFVTVLLNTKNHVLGIETISVGTLNSTNVHPREVFKCAVSHSAAAIILAHNHPSGDPSPSRQDLELTHRLVKLGEMMGIQILDHLVIGNGRWVSLKKEGYS